MRATRSTSARRIVQACCLLLLFATVAAAQDNLIVPGHSVGKVELGMTRARVRELLGEPTVALNEVSGIQSDGWFTGKHSLKVFFVNGEVVEIVLTSPRFRTSDGITTRTSIAKIRRRYKDLKSSFSSDTKSGDKLAVYHSAGRGIAFGRMAPDSPNKDASLSSIIILRPGAPLLYGE